VAEEIATETREAPNHGNKFTFC